MKLISSFLFLLMLSTPADKNLEGWELLGDVKVVRVYDDFLEQEVEKPEFSEALKRRNKSEISLNEIALSMRQFKQKNYFKELSEVIQSRQVCLKPDQPNESKCPRMAWS